MPCPDLYYCVTKACNVSSLDNVVNSRRVAMGRRNYISLKIKAGTAILISTTFLVHLKDLYIVGKIQFLRLPREVDRIKIP